MLIALLTPQLLFQMDGELGISANVSVTGNLSPSSDQEYDLGTSSNRWRDLYLSAPL